MKKKNKNSHPRKIKQFRYHNVYVIRTNGKPKKFRHPTYAFLLIGNTLLYVIITHSKIVNGEELIELRKNPNPNDKRKSYRSKTIQSDTKDKFGKVSSVMNIGSQGLIPLAMFLGGLAITYLGSVGLLAVCSGGLIITALVLFFARPVRDL